MDNKNEIEKKIEKRINEALAEVGDLREAFSPFEVDGGRPLGLVAPLLQALKDGAECGTYADLESLSVIEGNLLEEDLRTLDRLVHAIIPSLEPIAIGDDLTLTLTHGGSVLWSIPGEAYAASGCDPNLVATIIVYMQTTNGERRLSLGYMVKDRQTWDLKCRMLFDVGNEVGGALHRILRSALGAMVR